MVKHFRPDVRAHFPVFVLFCFYDTIKDSCLCVKSTYLLFHSRGKMGNWHPQNWHGLWISPEVSLTHTLV